jgi:hypothetical protein
MPGGVEISSAQRVPGLYLLHEKENSDHQGHWVGVTSFAKWNFACYVYSLAAYFKIAENRAQ